MTRFVSTTGGPLEGSPHGGQPHAGRSPRGPKGRERQTLRSRAPSHAAYTPWTSRGCTGSWRWMLLLNGRSRAYRVGVGRAIAAQLSPPFSGVCSTRHVGGPVVTSAARSDRRVPAADGHGTGRNRAGPPATCALPGVLLLRRCKRSSASFCSVPHYQRLWRDRHAVGRCDASIDTTWGLVSSARPSAMLSVPSGGGTRTIRAERY